MALGADRATVIRTVLGRVIKTIAIGGTAGAVLTAGTGPAISSVVLDVSLREPALVAALGAVMAAIAAASCAGPIKRSLRADPLAALRED